MVLSAQTQRNWKIFTGFACAVAGFQSVFRVDYGPHEHVFSGLQRWYNTKVDQMLGIDPATSSPPGRTGLPPGEPSVSTAATAAAAAAAVEDARNVRRAGSTGK